MRFLSTVLISISLLHSTAFGKIVDLRSGEPSSIEDVSSQGQIFVLGEYHYNPKIQNSQAEFMKLIINLREANQNFDFGWEFLNVDRYEEVSSTYQQYTAGDLSVSDFLTYHLGEYEGNVAYEVILETVKQEGGNLIPLNLSRSIKRQVSQGGIEALDPQYLPSDFQLGSDEYYERFIEAMGGHGGEQIDNYFAAQSLVDNVMAETMIDYRNFNLGFLVCGSFHSDFMHGVVEELNRRSNLEVITIKFLDSEGLSPEAIQQLIYDERYGPAADFAVVLP